MLITDGPSSTYKEIFKIYNFPHRPVRLFTYLIGSDSGSASEMHWMACENKGIIQILLFRRYIIDIVISGYYTRIETYDEIKDHVLHYIEVMARPMVMYQNDHPIHWTPVYVGGRVRILLFKLLWFQLKKHLITFRLTAFLMTKSVN